MLKHDAILWFLKVEEHTASGSFAMASGPGSLSTQCRPAHPPKRALGRTCGFARKGAAQGY